MLPIGGLKEKLLAAHRGGIKTVIIPKDNVKDLEEIPDNAKNSLDIRPVETIDEVLSIALENPPEGVDFSHLIAKEEKATPRRKSKRVESAVN